MQDLAADGGVFVRSMASRGSLGGLTLATGAVLAALDAAGYPRILLETVGVGQDGIAVAQAAHTTVVVTVPGLGDEIQALKAGLLEIADVLVVNKADRPEADSAAAALLMLQSLASTPAWQPPVLKTSALTGEGVAELAAALERHREFLAASGEGARRDRARARAAVLTAARGEMKRRLERLAAAPRSATNWPAVGAREQPPLDAPEALVAGLLGEGTPRGPGA
jgi:LAO/AO transport system kinase